MEFVFSDLNMLYTMSIPFLPFEKPRFNICATTKSYSVNDENSIGTARDVERILFYIVRLVCVLHNALVCLMMITITIGSELYILPLTMYIRNENAILIV